MNVAGIDMGSNAIRVTISKRAGKRGYHSPKDLITKERFPCRLGSDVFKSQTISDEKVHQLHAIFKEIKEVFEKYNVEKSMGVATSAFREADNGIKILRELEKLCPIKIKVITGKLEAKYMSEALERRKSFDPNHAHLHMDIGGGSLELSLYDEGKFVFQKSLDLGTLRLLVDTRTGQLVPNHCRQLDLINPVFKAKRIRDIVKEKGEKSLLIHGTGGNFRRLGRLKKHTLGSGKENSIKKEEVPFLLGTYMNHSGYELSKHVPLKEENAALIIPSLLMIQRVQNFWPAKKIVIPKISLSHAILDEL